MANLITDIRAILSIFDNEELAELDDLTGREVEQLAVSHPNVLVELYKETNGNFFRFCWSGLCPIIQVTGIGLTFTDKDLSVLKRLFQPTFISTDFSGCDLSYVWAIAACLKGCRFKDANLSATDLRLSDLSGSDLTGADLEGADLRGANLRNTTLVDVDLSDAQLQYADLRGAVFEDCLLMDAQLNHANLEGVDLSKVDLSASFT